MDQNTPLLLAALTVAGSFACAPAQAAPGTETYHFTASGFGPGAPSDPVSGSITLSFDSALPVAGASVDSIALDIAGHEYATANTAFGFNGLDLFVDGTLNGTAVLPGTDDFFLEGSVNPQGQFTFSPSFVYSTAGSGAVFGAREVSVDASVPEPSTLWLAAVGVTMLGALRLPRRPSGPER
jgi:PEP-CTERM motif